jgi:hypothetical protein
VDGILGQNLLLSQAFSVGIPSWMGFRLSQSLFSQTLLFTIEFWLSGSPSQEDFFFSFSMESQLSRSPFDESLFFCLRWNSGYQGAFLTNFSFFHDGILAIKEPFTRTFLFHDGTLAIKEPFSQTFIFSRWNSGYQGAFHTNFSFFMMEL